jgi:dihydroflavonol-4-reductase
MTTALITGATGQVGSAIVRVLLERGRPVRALVRDVERARALLPAGCELARGDVTDPASIQRALEGCDVLYHAAGLPEQWLPDAATFDRVNAEGTRHAVEAALEAKVRRFVYTSTIDVFPIRSGIEFDESRIDDEPKHTHSEISKQKADRIVVEAMGRGLDAVFLHPSGVYGPCPVAGVGLNRAIAQLVRAEVPLLLPGSIPTVYVDDIGSGHVLAEEMAEPGERFILHESSHTLADLTSMVVGVAGRGKVPPTLPLWCARVFALVGEGLARVTGRAPVVARGQVQFLQMNARPSSLRAQQRLGWKPTPFREGLARTTAWLGERGEI